MDRTGEGDREKKAPFDKVTTTGSPSEACKISLSLVGEKSKAAKHKVKRENSEEKRTIVRLM